MQVTRPGCLTKVIETAPHKPAQMVTSGHWLFIKLANYRNSKSAHITHVTNSTRPTATQPSVTCSMPVPLSNKCLLLSLTQVSG